MFDKPTNEKIKQWYDENHMASRMSESDETGERGGGKMMAES